MSEVTKKVMYGLRVIGDTELVGFSTQDNSDGEFCVSVSYELEQGGYGDPVWLVDKKETAQNVANTNTDWYNAGYNSPQNSYVGRLEVVEVELSIKSISKKDA